MPKSTDVVDFTEYRARSVVRQKRHDQFMDRQAPEQKARYDEILNALFNDPEVLEAE